MSNIQESVMRGIYLVKEYEPVPVQTVQNDEMA